MLVMIADVKFEPWFQSCVGQLVRATEIERSFFEDDQG